MAEIEILREKLSSIDDSVVFIRVSLIKSDK